MYLTIQDNHLKVSTQILTLFIQNLYNLDIELELDLDLVIFSPSSTLKIPILTLTLTFVFHPLLFYSA